MVSFFFFKQKTAYEMRISDWSSDVCSSDLSARARLPEKASAAQVDEQMNLSTIEALAIAWARIAEEAELPAGYEGTATPEAHRACEEIGRASCRERVCQYV